jgi:parallel beta-helix repeat protein
LEAGGPKPLGHILRSFLRGIGPIPAFVAELPVHGADLANMNTNRKLRQASSAKGAGVRNGRISTPRFKLLPAAIFLNLAVAATMAAPALAAGTDGTRIDLAGTCTGYALTPADAPNIPSIVAGKASGTVFCFGPGTYRMTKNIQPKSSDQLIGAGATRSDVVLTGAKPITAWTLTGGLYVHTGDVVSLPKAGNCFTGTACQYADSVFKNDNVLTRSLSPCSLTNVTVGKYCVDYTTKQIYVFDNPAGQNLEYSFVPTAIGSSTGVTIKDMTITKYANTDGSAAVVRVGVSSTIDNVEMSDNHACAVSLSGITGTVVKNSRLDYQGAEGYCGTSTGATFTNNEVDHNNTLAFKASFMGGGGKFWNAQNATVTDNYIHDNNGNGIWFDGDSKGNTISGNTTTNNSSIYGAGNGITYEVSCYATITSNTSSGNGMAGIQLNDAHNNTVGAVGAGNTVSNNRQYGIRVVAGRTGTHPLCGTVTASNNHVNYNSISMPIGTSWTGVQRVSPAVATGNSFSGNDYHLPLVTDCGTGLRWKWWDGGAMHSLKFSGTGAWQAGYNQDQAPDGTCGV